MAPSPTPAHRPVEIEPPSLDDLLAQPTRVRDLPAEVAWDLLARLAGLYPLLLAQVTQALRDPAGQNGHPEAAADHLLTVAEVARRLGVSKDTVYRKRWPFEVTQGGIRGRRFSADALARYLRQRTGR
jgi:excisionase family DNA binding protein